MEPPPAAARPTAFVFEGKPKQWCRGTDWWGAPWAGRRNAQVPRPVLRQFYERCAQLSVQLITVAASDAAAAACTSRWRSAQAELDAEVRALAPYHHRHLALLAPSTDPPHGESDAGALHAAAAWSISPIDHATVPATGGGSQSPQAEHGGGCGGLDASGGGGGGGGGGGDDVLSRTQSPRGTMPSAGASAAGFTAARAGEYAAFVAQRAVPKASSAARMWRVLRIMAPSFSLGDYGMRCVRSEECAATSVPGRECVRHAERRALAIESLAGASRATAG
eukprot:SAG11_NODE_76_length_18005_cov_6.523958_7_plen_279_part_00